MMFEDLIPDTYPIMSKPITVNLTNEQLNGNDDQARIDTPFVEYEEKNFPIKDLKRELTTKKKCRIFFMHPLIIMLLLMAAMCWCAAIGAYKNTALVFGFIFLGLIILGLTVLIGCSNVKSYQKKAFEQNLFI